MTPVRCICKGTILWFMILVSGTRDALAQQPGDSLIYDPGLAMLDRAGTADDYTRAAAYFEECMNGTPDQWLLPYYAAYCYIKASYETTGDSRKDDLLDKAQPLIDKGLVLKPGETELVILQAFLYQSRIQVNPMARGLAYSTKADASLKNAIRADDNNPRAWSLMGYNIYHTPAVIGGGAAKALPCFLKARDRFGTFKQDLPFLPRWGEPENRKMISLCRKSQGQVTQ